MMIGIGIPSRYSRIDRMNWLLEWLNGFASSKRLHGPYVITLAAADGGEIAGAERAHQQSDKHP